MEPPTVVSRKARKSLEFAICPKLQKGIPHRILEEKTPEEEFKGVKLEIMHLRIFGFSVFPPFA